jgi:hypothetical protein
VCDEHIDERDEPRLALVELRGVRLAAVDEWWLLVLPDLSDGPPHIASVGV